LLFAIAALSVPLGGVGDLMQYRIDQLTSHDQWSVLGWEAENIPRGVGLVLAQAVNPPAEGVVDDRVRSYLLGSVTTVEAGDGNTGDDHGVPLEVALALATQRELVAGGIRSMGPLVIPPVALALTEPPRSLVVSPREEIRVSQWALLRGDLDDAAAEAIEQQVEQLGVSALVVPIGGIATYPTLIPPETPPQSALQTIAHEWTHTALFFTPLGRAYGTGAEARNINETAADLVGAEVAQRLMARLGVTPSRPESPANRELRQRLQSIRLRTDELLAAGQIEEAEAYMEAERQDLVAQGYTIRRLNQAFFAFYGNYAEGPARSTEIPDALTRLRAGSASLGEFLTRAGHVTGVADLRRAAEEAAR
jgi:hypothetical protein